MKIVETNCELCMQDGGEVVYRDDALRIVCVDEAFHPGFCRVIWDAHVKEMTDLLPPDRERLMRAVWHVEAAVRDIMRPDKVNVASLGNMTPHVHWHIIPRYADDTHFPAPVWAEAKRAPDPAALAARIALLPQLHDAIVRQIASA